MIVSWQQNWTAAFVAIVLVGPVTWMLVDRKIPYDRIEGHMEPSDPKPGDRIGVEWRIKINRICPPSSDFNVTRVIIDATGKINEFIPVAGVYGTVDEPTNSNTLNRTFQLPPSIAPGPARYKSRACFACNPIQRIWPICVEQPDILFMIVP